MLNQALTKTWHAWKINVKVDFEFVSPGRIYEQLLSNLVHIKGLIVCKYIHYLFQAYISGEEVSQFREEEESNDGGTHQSD